MVSGSIWLKGSSIVAMISLYVKFILCHSVIIVHSFWFKMSYLFTLILYHDFFHVLYVSNKATNILVLILSTELEVVEKPTHQSTNRQQCVMCVEICLTLS